MSCGSWCVYYRDKGEHCKQCSDYQGNKRSRFEFGKIDLKKMAEGLARKDGRLIFFSHSLTSYYTSAESSCLEFISTFYHHYYVINPRDIPLEPTWDFDTCMKHILPRIEGCNILLYYKDDSHSPGVDMEIAEANRLNIPVIKLETQ